MFDINSKKWSAYIEGFDEEDFENLCRRLSTYYRDAQKRNQKITKNLVMRSFFILEDMQEEKYKKMEKKVDYTGVKHHDILKYGDEIIALSKAGKGALFISSEMKSLHNAKIAKNTIQNFLDKQVCFSFGEKIIELHKEEAWEEEIVLYLKKEYKVFISKGAVKKYILKMEGQ